MLIREILQKDNESIAKVIRDIFHELDAPKVGTAYADPILDTLYEVYQAPRSVYFVVELNGKVVGGCGVAPLEMLNPVQQDNTKVCELQKMYFLPEARGRGFGNEIMSTCLEHASKHGFKFCYIETMDDMLQAQRVYQKFGFKYIDGALGNTGHNSCGVHMLKPLNG